MFSAYITTDLRAGRYYAFGISGTNQPVGHALLEVPDHGRLDTRDRELPAPPSASNMRSGQSLFGYVCITHKDTVVIE